MKKKILITWPLPDAVMARARASYDVIAHGENPKITIEELLATAKNVDALLITLNEKCRKDVIDRMPDNIKCISTFSIGFDHIDVDASKARGIKVGNAPHGVTVATAEIAMLLLLGSARRASEGERMVRARALPAVDRWPDGSAQGPPDRRTCARRCREAYRRYLRKEPEAPDADAVLDRVYFGVDEWL